MLRLAALILCLLPTAGAQLRLLAIGDSLTDEYGELSAVFSVPDGDSDNPRAKNWPELIETHRPLQASLGTDSNGYPDLRITGFERNFGVISLTAVTWVEVLETTFSDTFGDEQAAIFYATKLALSDQLGDTDVAVIFLGGNDLDNVYTSIWNGTAPPGTLTAIADDIMDIHAWVRARQPGLPIVVCTVPDVGATPEHLAIFDSPEPARTQIRNFNLDLIDRANARPDTAVARIDTLTDRVFDQDPFHINGTLFTIPGDPENPPDHVFTKDDFHPSTVAQALIANEIFAAINQLIPGSLTPFSNREILQNVLGLDPDQPYLDYLQPYNLQAPAATADPDGDGLPNLVEMALGTPPDAFSAPLSGAWWPGSLLTYTPDPAALRYLQLTAEESTALQDWTPVPEARITTEGVIAPTDEPVSFFRLNAKPRP